MGLLVTIYLVLVNTSNSLLLGFSPALEFTALDAWMLVCKLFLMGALFEYGILLKVY